jgi:hypothetical protein
MRKVVLLAAFLVLLVASPAGAHTGVGATNARAVLDRVAPEVPGLVVRVDRSTITVVNRTGRRVVVAGYEGEPYLELDGHRVRRNLRSPATAINQSASGNGSDQDADAAAPPRWEVVAGGDSWSWHDHRLHWMQAAPDHPDRRQELAPWTLSLTAGGEPVEVSGRLLWVPGPSTVPWAAGAVLAAAAMAVLAAVAGALPALAAGLLLVGASAVVVWRGAAGPSIAVAIAAVLALGAVWRARRARPLAVQGAALVGLAAALVSGASEWTDLGRSDPSVPVAAWLYRLAVTLAVGIGVGVAGVGVWRTARVPIGTAPRAGWRDGADDG